jgi:ParB family protein of integrating conjugative element (PFGI_1 class)
MKPPTSEEITRQLQQVHFPQKPGREVTAAPDGDMPMVVSLEQLHPYELNPRVIRNPMYNELKTSIRERGLDQPPSITRRPNEQHFIIRNGGNTRLSILGELWQETREERFFRIHCLFRPWQSESHALLGHLAESDLHGQLTFIERALAVAKLEEMFQEPGAPMSQRELSARLSQGGYPVSQSHISRMFDALEHLLPAIPQVLYAGLGKPAIERLITLRRRAESAWNQYFGDAQQFALLWLEVLSTFEGDKSELDASELQDELIAKMAVILNQTPRLLALEMHQEQRVPPHASNNAHPLPQYLEDDPPHPLPESVDASETSIESSSPKQRRSGSDPSSAKEPRLSHIRQALSDELPAVKQPGGIHDVQSPVSSATPNTTMLDGIRGLRETCASLATDLAIYADASALVRPQADGLGFTLSLEHRELLSPRYTGIQLLLSALLRLHSEGALSQRQLWPAAVLGHRLVGAYDLPFAERPSLTVGLERLPDAQLEQLFALIRHARRLIDMTLSPTR